MLRSFERFAHTYGQYNVVQKKLIKKYLPQLKNRVVDLGCGSEGLCIYRDFEFYLGVDSSLEMLKRNPCPTIKADFNTKECYELVGKYDFEQIVSFSALQWAEDLGFVFREIKKLNKEYLLVLFTSGTFSSLHRELGIKSPIYSKEEILEYAEILQPREIETLDYRLYFETPKELLEYIKYSGVSGNVSCPYSRLIKFIKTFPTNFLEFEIVVIK